MSVIGDLLNHRLVQGMYTLPLKRESSGLNQEGFEVSSKLPVAFRPKHLHKMNIYSGCSWQFIAIGSYNLFQSATCLLHWSEEVELLDTCISYM